MTIVLGFSGGSVAPILWGHFQAIKSFICVDLKESCEVPSGWNPLQRVTTVSMGFTLTGGHQYCPHVLMKQHQRHRCKSSESPSERCTTGRSGRGGSGWWVVEAVEGGGEERRVLQGGETSRVREIRVCSRGAKVREKNIFLAWIQMMSTCRLG